MSQPGVTAAFLDRIITLLAPLFLAATGGDVEAARDTVRVTLASYNARNDTELRLAALIVAFGFGALDALGKAVNPGLSLDQVMRLRSHATALSRAGHQNQAVLDKLHKQGSGESAPARTDLPASTEAEDLLAFARMPARSKAPAAPPTGPQRRAAEKAKRQQEYRARLAGLAGGSTTRH
jgi:hypothetical protein